MSYIIRNIKILWPLGQAVKTPPFHGGNTGSNPVGVIKMQTASKDYSLEAVFHYRLTFNSFKIVYFKKTANVPFFYMDVVGSLWTKLIVTGQTRKRSRSVSKNGRCIPPSKRGT
jgi:hypothetical protein